MQNLKNSQGFSLLEVMVGLFMLSVIVLPMTGILTAHCKQVASLGIKITALNLAQLKLEEFKNAGDAAVSPGPVNFEGSFHRYSYTVTTSPCTYGTIPLVTTLTTTITIYYSNDITSIPVASLTGEIERK